MTIYETLGICFHKLYGEICIVIVCYVEYEHSTFGHKLNWYKNKNKNKGLSWPYPMDWNEAKFSFRASAMEKTRTEGISKFKPSQLKLFF
jgi:hypothetical protein